MKTIVYGGPEHDVKAAPAVGLVFESGVPQPVTDEQAAILTARFENEYLEGTAEEVAAMKRADGQPCRGTPNPNYGKPKTPYFRIVSDSSTPAASDAPKSATASDATAKPPTVSASMGAASV